MTSSSPRTVLVAAIVSGIAILASLALLVLDYLATTQGRTIQQVIDARWNRTLLLGVLLIIGLGWSIWLVRHRSWRDLAVIGVSVLTAVALIGTSVAAWGAINSPRDVVLTSMQCDAEALRTSGGDPLATCEIAAVDTIVLLSDTPSGSQWIPGAMEGNTTSRFDDLPGGGWDATITVDGPRDTTAVHIVAMRGDRATRIGAFTPTLNQENVRSEWRGVVRVPGDTDDIRVLFFESPGDEVPSAGLRMNVRACHGQSIRTFDPVQCEPMEITEPLVSEPTTTGARTWRYPISEVRGSTQAMTNLEARTYTLTPDFATIQMLTQSADVLIIPAAMPQTEENSVIRPGQSTFDVTVEPNSGELEYTVYVFPSGPTFAQGGT